MRTPVKCNTHARFAVRSFGTNGAYVLSCGKHLGNVVKAVFVAENKAAVVQELPGHWPSDIVSFDGRLVRVGITERKKIGYPE